MMLLTHHVLVNEEVKVRRGIQPGFLHLGNDNDLIMQEFELVALWKAYQAMLEGEKLCDTN